MDHVVAGHAEEARENVGRDKTQRMTHMQPDPRGVREHVHDEFLGPAGVETRLTRIRSVEGAILLPERLPFLLDLAGQFRCVAVGEGVGF